MDHPLQGRDLGNGWIEAEGEAQVVNITPEEARNHPHANILLRTVGTERDVDIDIFRLELEKGDKLLLCSDGLWGEVEDEDIEAILNQFEDPRICARELIRAAHHGGGKDNVTMLLVGIDR